MTTIEGIRRRLTQPIGSTAETSPPDSSPPEARSRGQRRSPAGRRGALNRQRSQIGIDIGSSAVRAVELSFGRGRPPTVVRFGQVGLPDGAVVEGEVVDADVVGRAIRTLWTQAGFTTTSVVVGVSSQRVMVREADVTAMSEADFRQALRFEAADLIPIQVDDAAMDFRIVEPRLPGTGEGHAKMRILLAAAHKATIDAHMAALRIGGLSPTAIGVGGLALVRSLHLVESEGDAVQAIVDVGADITTVAVAAGGDLRFVRVLAGGGRAYTKLIETEQGVLSGEAEKRKRGGATPNGGLSDDDPLLNQIGATLDYFAAQGDFGALSRVVVSGGGSRYEPFMRKLGEKLVWEVVPAAAPAGLGELDGIDVNRAEAVLQTATGLAAWRGRADGTRINLLPAEILAARQERRALLAVVAAAGAVAVLLAGAWYNQHQRVGTVRRQTAAINASGAAEQSAVSRLEPVSAYQQAIAARSELVKSTETGDVDIHGLLGAIAAHLPSGLSLTNLQVATGTTATTGSATTPTTAAGGSSASAAGVVGTVDMSVTGRGSTATVANFLRSMAKFPALVNVIVPSESASDGTVTFSATADLTSKAPMTVRKDA